MRVFVTGGTGFIGSYVVKALSDAGCETTVLARNTEKAVGLLRLSGVSFVPGDLNNFESIRPLLAGHDALVHIALHWGEGAVNMLQNDTLSSVRLFEAAADAGISSILYTSSTSVNDWVYTDPRAAREGAVHSVSEQTKQNPVTYYGAAKGASELYLNAVSFQRNLRAGIIRPGYTFGNPVVEGAATQADRRFAEIAAAAQAGAPIRVTKYDGTQFIWAGDLARLYVAVLFSTVHGRMFFGLGAEFLSWEWVAERAAALFDSKSEIIVETDGRAAEPALFDVSAMEAEFGLSFTCRDKIAEHLRFLGTKS